MEKVEIRFFQYSDMNRLIDLVMEMIGDENRVEVAKTIVEDFYTNNEYRVFVIETFDLVIGFGVIKFSPFEGANGVAELVWLGIDKNYKRKRLGSRLVNEIEQYARQNNIRKIYVKTNIDNKISVCFWIIHNYRFEARMLDFNLQSSDVYFLGKSL